MSIPITQPVQALSIPPLLDVIGLLIPGASLKSKFIPVDASGLKFSLPLPASDFPGPILSVTELVVFLLPTTRLPDSHGALFYWQVSIAESPAYDGAHLPPGTGFELLGAVTPSKPSGVFPTKWSEHEQVVELVASGRPLVVTIGVSFEPLENIFNLSASLADPHSSRLLVAQLVASDLFRFMQSFDTGAAGSSHMVVPCNIFDRWLKRFESRFRRDPNFFLRTDE
jgi:Protein of unknown function (DUF775)